MLLVRETRCGLDEVRHFGAIAIARSDKVTTIGDADFSLALRSTAKPFLLAALLDGPLSDQIFSSSELAVMSSSHNGETEHISAVLSLLSRYGIPPELIHCGEHPPWRSWSRASPLGNNCSGKHAAFLIAAHIMGVRLEDYMNQDGAVHQEIISRLPSYYGSKPISIGIDGCSIPTCAFPFASIASAARGYALDTLGPNLARVRQAHKEAYYFVGGEDRLESYLIGRYGLAAKSGSDGLWTIGVPDLGIGLAGKVWSGVEAAVQLALLHVLATLGVIDLKGDPYLAEYHTRIRRSLTGLDVGRIEACFPVPPLN